MVGYGRAGRDHGKPGAPGVQVGRLIVEPHENEVPCDCVGRCVHNHGVRYVQAWVIWDPHSGPIGDTYSTKREATIEARRLQGIVT